MTELTVALLLLILGLGFGWIVGLMVRRLRG